jgi:hypothetical protein
MSNQIPVYMKLDRALSFYVNSSPIHYIWGFPCFRYPFFRFLYYISLSNSICLSLSLSLPVLLSCIRFFLEYSSDIFLCITAHGVLYRVYRPLLYCTVLNSELYVYVSHSYPLYTQFISCPAHGAVCLSDALFIRQRVIITVPIFQRRQLIPLQEVSGAEWHPACRLDCVYSAPKLIWKLISFFPL